MKGSKKLYYVSVRNNSPFGRMGVCDALSTNEWANFIVATSLPHALRLCYCQQIKYRHVDMHQLVRGKWKSKCILHQEK